MLLTQMQAAGVKCTCISPRKGRDSALLDGEWMSKVAIRADLIRANPNHDHICCIHSLLLEMIIGSDGHC